MSSKTLAEFDAEIAAESKLLDRDLAWFGVAFVNEAGRRVDPMRAELLTGKRWKVRK